MNIDEKAFFMIIGGIIVSIINHFYIKRRERENEIRKYLFQIANNLRTLQFEYNNSYNLFQKNQTEEGQKARSSFLKTYNETYNLIYFYFEELTKIYISQMTPVINNLYEIEEAYLRRIKKNELNIERNKINEFLYEDQNFIGEGKFFYQLYELLKIKLKSPLEYIDFKKINYDNILEYNPNNSKNRRFSNE
ncbi:hypothetical protein N5U04_06950 [Aliarcobacter butzleri]|uniref:hypothetical protein n=1 Tax=Aliarcobacter butzleri TaxID=28197 RepID=UPI001EDA4428|nr:hypothetical protein [Aliarcobacter butzleri]MCG3658320.1 hypothetical protein [Aliarcobacter butzleri]MCT7550699.1 hypothetical protein [Aliarcobacter butzleri]MCT7559298.1 hypothetical protein [Aliarcobacter butzleri]